MNLPDYQYKWWFMHLVVLYMFWDFFTNLNPFSCTKFNFVSLCASCTESLLFPPQQMKTFPTKTVKVAVQWWLELFCHGVGVLFIKTCFCRTREKVPANKNLLCPQFARWKTMKRKLLSERLNGKLNNRWNRIWKKYETK